MAMTMRLSALLLVIMLINECLCELLQIVSLPITYPTSSVAKKDIVSKDVEGTTGEAAGAS
jgi:Zn-dependent membrane protease YugP